MKLHYRRITGNLANLLCWIAYRTTRVPQSTEGHTHRFVSFYLTSGLNLRTEEGTTIEAPNQITLWIVPPGMFHEWVAIDHHPGQVYDMTPFHRPHQIAVA